MSLEKGANWAVNIALVVVVIWLVWAATHNNIKNQKFSGDAKQTNNYKISKNYALGFIDFALMPFNIHGCTRPDKIDYEPQKAQQDEVDMKVLVNAAKMDIEERL